MKNILPIIIGFAISYLLFSFIILDINAINWEEGARAAFVLVSLGMSLVTALIINKDFQ